MGTSIADPAAMRLCASLLKLRAETMNLAAVTIESNVAQMGFTGPAADVFRSAITTNGSSVRSIHDRLCAVADTLTREAAVVEEQQRQEALAQSQGTMMWD